MCIWVCAFEYRYSWREVEWIFWSWNYRNLWPIWCGSSARAICTIHHLAIFPTLLECSLVIMMHLSLTIEVCILYSVDYSFAKSTGNTDFFFSERFLSPGICRLRPCVLCMLGMKGKGQRALWYWRKVGMSPSSGPWVNFIYKLWVLVSWNLSKRKRSLSG